MVPSEDEIRTFVTEQYRLWSEDKIDEMMALFRQMGRNGYTIEYVGSPPANGEDVMATMIAEHGGKTHTTLKQIIVNGCEAATVVDNISVETGEILPSIETYSFGDGTFHVRYFHNEPGK